MRDDIPTDDVIKLLKARGFSVSHAQLCRWQREGLIPSPVQIGLGRGKGSYAVYPPAAVEQAAAVAHLLTQKRDFEWVGWKLWSAGFEVDQRYSVGVLTAAAADVDALVDTWLKDDAETEDTRGQVANGLWADRPASREGKRIRKALGPDRMERFAAMLIDILAGEFKDWPLDYDPESSDAKDYRLTMDIGLGVHTGRTDRIGQVGPLLQGNIGTILSSLSDALSETPWSERLRQASTEELREAGSEVLQLIHIIATIGEVLDHLTNRSNTFGLGRLSRLSAELTPKMEAYFILGWLAYRNQPGVHSGVHGILDAVSESETKAMAPDLKEKGLSRSRRRTPPGA